MVNQTSIPLWATILSIFGFGSFFGGVITQLLSSRQRRKDWVKDNKKQEWRELISTLSQSFHHLKNYSPGNGIVAISGEQEKGLLEADAEARRGIESRIFVAHQIQRENVLERWQLLAGEKDWSRMVEYWNSLHATLIAAAHKDLDIKERNWFWQRWFGS
jgi:hypothetical protein